MVPSVVSPAAVDHTAAVSSDMMLQANSGQQLGQHVASGLTAPVVPATTEAMDNNAFSISQPAAMQSLPPAIASSASAANESTASQPNLDNGICCSFYFCLLNITIIIIC